MERGNQRLVEVKDLKPGMVVSRAVRNFQGALLLKEDSALDERKIKLLKNWGVDLVYVWADERDSDPEQEPRADIRERILLRFSPYAQNSLMSQLREVALELASLEENHGEGS
ncbi:MAG: hypothetical protein ACK4WB_09890 [Desulfatiglandales bacterium]